MKRPAASKRRVNVGLLPRDALRTTRQRSRCGTGAQKMLEITIATFITLTEGTPRQQPESNPAGSGSEVR